MKCVGVCVCIYVIKKFLFIEYFHERTLTSNIRYNCKNAIKNK